MLGKWKARLGVGGDDLADFFNGRDFSVEGGGNGKAGFQGDQVADMAALKIEGRLAQGLEVGKGGSFWERGGYLAVAPAMGQFMAAEIFGAMAGEVGADIFDRRASGR